MGALGVGLSALGAVSAANAASNAAESSQTQLRFNASMAKINSQLSESNAQATLLAGQRAEQNVRLKTANLKSDQRASMAANGIDLGSQTALNILTSTDVMGEVDANQTAANALRAAWGYRTQAANYDAQAAFASASADTISPRNAYTSTLLGSSGQVAMNWYIYSKGAGLATTSGNATGT
jgi:hypothetical protein